MISIVIPLFNKEKAIARCLDSVLSQTYADFECVVVDDGSNDKSASVVLSYKDDRIRYVYKENGGVSSARNFGLKNARGEWIVYLDADDYFLPDALKVMRSCAMKYSADVAIADVYNAFANKKIRSGYRDISGLLCNAPKAVFFDLIAPRTGNLLVKKSIALNYTFNERVSRYEDVEVFFPMVRNHRVAYSHIPVMIHTSDYNDLCYANPARFSKDYITQIEINGGIPFWERLSLYRLMHAAYGSYKERKEDLNLLYGRYFCKMKFSSFLFILVRVYKKIWKMFKKNI